jgi:hypothetical protein
MQDDGNKMSPEEILINQEPTRGKPKRKYRTMSHGEYFYQELYSLAGDVLSLLEKKRLNYFPRLPKSSRNMSLTIYYIGKAIDTHQILCTHADIHIIGSMMQALRMKSGILSMQIDIDFISYRSRI